MEDRLVTVHGLSYNITRCFKRFFFLFKVKTAEEAMFLADLQWHLQWEAYTLALEYALALHSHQNSTLLLKADTDTNESLGAS